MSKAYNSFDHDGANVDFMTPVRGIMKYCGNGSGRKVEFNNGHLFEILKGSAPDSYSIALTIVKPSQKLERHKHLQATEIYLGLSGRGTVVVEKQHQDLGPGDLIVIEPGEDHHAEAGKGAFEFYAITIPAYDPNDYHPTGQEK